MLVPSRQVGNNLDIEGNITVTTGVESWSFIIDQVVRELHRLP